SDMKLKLAESINKESDKYHHPTGQQRELASLQLIAEVVTADLGVESEFVVGNSRQPKGSSSFLHEESSQRKVNSRTLETELVDVLIPMSSVFEVHARFENTLYGYFLGKAVAFPVVKSKEERLMMVSKLFKERMFVRGSHCLPKQQVSKSAYQKKTTSTPVSNAYLKEDNGIHMDDLLMIQGRRCGLLLGRLKDEKSILRDVQESDDDADVANDCDKTTFSKSLSNSISENM
ncbi:hypothetical protein Tco_1296838, partial [Tanacetum coccineum]